MIETVYSERLKTITEFIQIFRWEGDGGAIYDTDIPLPQVAETNTPCSMDLAWERLNIENTIKRTT